MYSILYYNAFCKASRILDNILKTIDTKQYLWNTIFGHFLISLIPLPATYEEYCDIVLDWDDFFSFWEWISILIAIVLLWIITIPIGIIIIAFFFVKYGVEYHFENKINKNEPREFKD